MNQNMDPITELIINSNPKQLAQTLTDSAQKDNAISEHCHIAKHNTSNFAKHIAEAQYRYKYRKVFLLLKELYHESVCIFFKKATVRNPEQILIVPALSLAFLRNLKYYGYPIIPIAVREITEKERLGTESCDRMIRYKYWTWNQVMRDERKITSKTNNANWITELQRIKEIYPIDMSIYQKLSKPLRRAKKSLRPNGQLKLFNIG